MRNVLITVLSVLALAALVGGGVWWVQALTAATGVIVLSLVVFLYRRFTREFPDGQWACHVAAAAFYLGWLGVAASRACGAITTCRSN